MSKTVSLEELHNRIDELLARVRSANEDVILAEKGAPVARMAAIAESNGGRKPRVPGSAKGEIWISDDFDDPLPEEILRAFEGDA